MCILDWAQVCAPLAYRQYDLHNIKSLNHFTQIDVNTLVMHLTYILSVISALRKENACKLQDSFSTEQEEGRSNITKERLGT